MSTLGNAGYPFRVIGRGGGWRWRIRTVKLHAMQWLTPGLYMTCVVLTLRSQNAAWSEVRLIGAGVRERLYPARCTHARHRRSWCFARGA